jgi:tetratricopeptide (TPR) repeat protein
MLAARHTGAGSISEPEQKAINQAIEAGVALHQRGLIDDAERLYAGILKLAPKHFDAMHLLGLIHRQRGDSEGALELIGAALELNVGVTGVVARRQPFRLDLLTGLGQFRESLF